MFFFLYKYVLQTLFWSIPQASKYFYKDENALKTK